ncbi:hypothetical protein SAMN05421636_104302 [Pricia antarctica]|uniref:Response receiver domain-containing protein n=1 Tax=Pricia antarctica TaxID=641691 RepID=A0A1G7BUG9_9FLAO|nr:response regulator receiver domain [Pricia antarctica]SDE30719.1 hypothetical protein SAMN05421636_104302 [Pricia antarctica]
MTLLQKTKEIISDSIKSVIFIDEKGLESYQETSSSTVLEESLSKSLYKNFKKKGVSLTTHKFSPNDLKDDGIKEYLLKRRDLVLLDWRLDGDSSGELYSLEILSEIVKSQHLHFCSIYTTEPKVINIINNIRSYFTGYNIEYYDKIIEDLSAYEESFGSQPFTEITYDVKHNGRLFNQFGNIDTDLPTTITESTGLSFAEALVQVKHALSGFHKSSKTNPVPAVIDHTNKTLVINNTIITIIPKTENSATKILAKLSKQVKNSKSCYSQILGLDMQNSLLNEAAFIDENLLSTTLDTLMYHRKQLEESNLDNDFPNFIKSVMYENIKLSIQKNSFKSLEKSFLDKITKSKPKTSDSEIAKLNTFYNGSILTKKATLGFGDLLIDSAKNEYYLCITALCDCLFPDKIKNNFYFVKGKKVSNFKKEIKEGDSGFKSFINHETCIVWANEGEYIKPFQIHVHSSKYNNGKIEMKLINENELLTLELEYKFTLKTSYTQRIANHSFSYPIRVGVDFVKG